MNANYSGFRLVATTGAAVVSRAPKPSQRLIGAEISALDSRGVRVHGVLAHVQKRIYATHEGRIVVAWNHDETAQPTVYIDGKATKSYTLKLRFKNKKFGTF